MEERRSLPRFPYRTDIAIEQNGNVVATGTTLDINTQAVQATFDLELPKLDYAVIRLRLPNGQRMSNPVQTIRMCGQANGTCKAVFLFIKLDNIAYQAIVDFGGQNWLHKHNGKLLN